MAYYYNKTKFIITFCRVFSRSNVIGNTPPMNLRLNFGYIARRNFQKTGYPAYTGGSVPAYRGTAYIYDSSAYTAYSVLCLIGTAYSTGARRRALECAGHYAGMLAACA